ncbi:MAG: SDR family oxidoreductase [Patescibacteria group bacterium]
MNPVALVTGATSDLGQEVAKQLQARGINTIMASKDEQQGIDAANQIRQQGLDVFFQPLDVVSRLSIEALKTYVMHQFGRLDIIVNAEEIFEDLNLISTPTAGAPFGVTEEQYFERTMDVNLYGPLRLADTFTPMMKEAQFGRIVHVSSDLAELNNMEAGYPAYRLSKAALNGLTRTLAAELRQFPNIKVNSALVDWREPELADQPKKELKPEQVMNVVWLATLPQNGPTGGFFRNMQQVPW